MILCEYGMVHYTMVYSQITMVHFLMGITITSKDINNIILLRASETALANIMTIVVQLAVRESLTTSSTQRQIETINTNLKNVYCVLYT